jgi:serine/threonine protein kinase
MIEDPRLTELLLRWRESVERGAPLTAEELCRDCPELIDGVKRLIDFWQSAHPLLRVPGPQQPPATRGTSPRPHEPAQAQGGLFAGGLHLAPGDEPVPTFRLVQRLGAGGFGEVWKALGPRRIPFALKFLPLRAAGGEEVRSLALMPIRHPHLLKVFATWQVPGVLIVAMELADGSLADRFQECTQQGLAGIPQAELLRYLQEAATAIDYLNEERQGPDGMQSVPHRDIKPQNLLLVAGSVKVGDYGLTKLLEREQTVTGAGKGSRLLTVAYAAPEFFSEYTSCHSDQYSLAITYCQLRGGRLPFSGSGAQIMAGHLSQRPDLSMLPPAERSAVARALAKNPEQRWPSCQAFVQALVASSQTPGAWVDNQLRRLGAVADPEAESMAPATPTSPQQGEGGGGRGPGDRSGGGGDWPGGQRCPNCQYLNEEGAAFCERCQADLRGPAAPPPRSAQTSDHADLRYLRGAHSRGASGIGKLLGGLVSGVGTVVGGVIGGLGSLLDRLLGTRSLSWSMDVRGGKELSEAGSHSLGVKTLPETIRRHTDISFPARVRLGTTHHLRVQMVPAQEQLPSGEVVDLPKYHTYDVTVNLVVPREERPLLVTVSVTAENFEIDETPRADLVVPLTGKSDAVLFQLRGLAVGKGRIMLDFAQDGRPVGSVDLASEVVAAGTPLTDEPAQRQGEIDLQRRPGPAPDVILKVFEHRHGPQPGRLHFVLSSSDPRLRDLPVLDGDLGTQDLKSEVTAWVENQLRRLGAVADRADLSADEVERTLATLGNHLYEQLLPKPLQELCWTFRQRGVRTVLVLSDEPHIPWELIKPYRTNAAGALEDDAFWGEAFALTHWLRGRPPAAQFTCNRIVAMAAGAASIPPQPPGAVRDMVVVTPGTAPPAPEALPASPGLPAADAELAVVRCLERPGATVRVLPSRRRELHALLEGGEFDLLHLACHGTFGGLQMADASAVLMEDGVFSAAELSSRLAAVLGRTEPLLFFNACQSGRLGFSLTQLGSWGARLVQLGCGGFVGSLWPVTDRAALAFARAFYQSLSQGRPIGEAIWQARQQVRSSFPNDPTWLAYCCFADPLACLQCAGTVSPPAGEARRNG